MPIENNAYEENARLRLFRWLRELKSGKQRVKNQRAFMSKIYYERKHHHLLLMQIFYYPVQCCKI